MLKNLKTRREPHGLLIRKRQKKSKGTLACFDRILFCGYLPIQSGWAIAPFLKQNQNYFRHLKGFPIENAEKIHTHAEAKAGKFGRPIEYMSVPTRKEDLARKMAEAERIKRGLICIFSVLEPRFIIRYSTFCGFEEL